MDPISKQTQILVDQLDPERGYGEFSYHEIVDGCLDGRFVIKPGDPVPVLRNKGRSMKGTGQSLELTKPENIKVRKHFVTRFEEYAANDFEVAYNSLMDLIKKRDVKAVMYYMDRVMGKPRETRDVASSEMMATFIASLAGTRMAQVEQPEPKVIIDATDYREA
tara:strand:+ start:68 stop:559 length:492 start_codon:yes stop_codon:yes gene_type:complete